MASKGETNGTAGKHVLKVDPAPSRQIIGILKTRGIRKLQKIIMVHTSYTGYTVQAQAGRL